MVLKLVNLSTNLITINKDIKLKSKEIIQVDPGNMMEFDLTRIKNLKELGILKVTEQDTVPKTKSKKSKNN